MVVGPSGIVISVLRAPGSIRPSAVTVEVLPAAVAVALTATVAPSFHRPASVSRLAISATTVRSVADAAA